MWKNWEEKENKKKKKKFQGVLHVFNKGEGFFNHYPYITIGNDNFLGS